MTTSPARSLSALFFGVPFAALAIVGCGDTQGATAASELISDVPELALVEELRIGSFDDPDLGFSRIGRAEVGRDGRIFVSEVQAAEIRVFDADGRFLYRFGRRGEGPGEFESMGAMGVTGDTVWVIEAFNDRVTLFDRDGNLLSARTSDPVRILVPECSGYVSPQRLTEDGTFSSWMNSIRCGSDDRENDIDPNDSIPVPRVRFAATGEVLDTVGWDPFPPPTMRTPPGFETRETAPRVEVGGERFRVPSPPLPRRLRWVGLPDGKLVTDVTLATSAAASSFLVARLDLRGDTVYARRLRYLPVRYSDADLDALAEDAASNPSGGLVLVEGGMIVQPGEPDPEVSARARARIRAQMSFPEFRPPIGTSTATSDGSMWIDLGAEGARSYLLLDPDGDTRGRITLAEGASIEWRSGDTILVSEPDEFDVPWLVRYRIEG